jgi:hypothetical protein
MRRLLPLLLATAACVPRAEAPASAAPAWTATPVATIGTDSGETSFTSIRSLLFSPQGELLVLDDRAKEVKVFDSTGRYLRPIGRSGDGPGEYARPYSLAWLGDTLAVLDPGNSRIGLFDGRGKWAGQLRVQPITGGSDVRLYRTARATFWVYGYKPVDGGSTGLFIQYTASGPRDTLPHLRPASARTTTITCEYPDRSLHFFDAPFAPRLLQSPTPMGERVVAGTDAYRILFLGATGDTVRTIQRNVPLAPIGDSAWTAGLAEWNTRPAGGRCDADGFDRPNGKPVLSALFYDPQGRLWVEVHVPDGVRYDVYDAQGTQVGAVRGLPTSGEVDPAFVDDRIAIALPDDGGFPRIGIYRIGVAR